MNKVCIAVLKARRLCLLPVSELWEHLRGNQYKVVFDDGELAMSSTEIIISWYGWAYNRMDKSMPLNKDNTIIAHYSRGRRVGKSTINHLNHNLAQLVEHQGKRHDNVFVNKLAKVMTFTNNDLYNDALDHTGRYVIGTWVMDAIHLHFHPALQAIKEEIPDDSPADEISRSIALSEKAIKSDLKNPDGSINAISYGASRYYVKSNQSAQTVFRRGMLSDTNGDTFPHPITECHLTGMRSKTDAAIISREGADAIEATKEELSGRTMTSRELSYSAAAKYKTIIGDCGSTEYAYVTIDDMETLANYKGIYYRHPDDKDKKGKLRMMRGDESELLGVLIARRTQYTCKLEDPHMTCSTCVGLLSESVPPGVVFGPDISRALTQKQAQNSLSKKHVMDGSISSSKVTDKKFQMFFKEQKGYTLFKSIPSYIKLTLSVPARLGYGLDQVVNAQKVSNLALDKVARISDIGVIVDKKASTIQEVVPLTSDGTYVNFTYDFLEWMHANPGIKVATRDEILLDVTELPSNIPVFVKPPRVADSSRAIDMVCSMLQRAGAAEQTVSKYGVISTTTEILELSKINISVIETILSSALCEKGTAILGRGMGDVEHQQNFSIIMNRSISTKIIYRGQSDTLMQASNYVMDKRNDGSMDGVLCPAEVMADSDREW